MISRNHTVWRRTERLCRCAGLACAAALAWAALASAARAQEALKFSAPLAINRVSVRCGNPVMAAGRDGVAFAVWDGYDGRGARHVWFAQRAASGQWSEEIALSAAVSGDNCEPSLAVDPKGYPHVVWRARIDGVGQIYYTRRKGDDEPVDEAEILRWSIPNRLDRVEGLNCESARLAFDGEGRPHALWQAGLGSRYAIYAAWAPFKGRWRDFCLSGAGEGAAYCFLPQLVRGGPDILAVWVEADFEGLGLRLRAARAPQTARDAWTPAELASLAGLPADRLPTLLSDVGGRVWALWSDLNGGVFERIVLHTNGDGRLAPRTLIADDRPHAVNRVPAAGPGDPDGFVLCWVIESDGARRIVARSLSPEAAGAGPSVIISDPRDPFVAAPCMAPVPGGAHVAWVSEFASGGDGSVFYSRLVR